MQIVPYDISSQKSSLQPASIVMSPTTSPTKFPRRQHARALTAARTHLRTNTADAYSLPAASHYVVSKSAASLSTVWNVTSLLTAWLAVNDRTASRAVVGAYFSLHRSVMLHESRSVSTAHQRPDLHMVLPHTVLQDRRVFLSVVHSQLPQPLQAVPTEATSRLQPESAVQPARL